MNFSYVSYSHNKLEIFLLLLFEIKTTACFPLKNGARIAPCTGLAETHCTHIVIVVAIVVLVAIVEVLFPGGVAIFLRRRPVVVVGK